MKFKIFNLSFYLRVYAHESLHVEVIIKSVGAPVIPHPIKFPMLELINHPNFYVCFRFFETLCDFDICLVFQVPEGTAVTSQTA